MATSKSPRRPHTSSPSSPNLDFQLRSRVNTDFYSAPTFEEPKKKSSGFLPHPPSPTTLDVHAVPDIRRKRSSNPPTISTSNPTVAISRVSSSRPPSSHKNTVETYSDDEEEEGEGEEEEEEDTEDDDGFIDVQEEFYTVQQPYKVNPSDIIARPASRSSKLSESAQRGMALLSETYSTSREGSPIPPSISSISKNDELKVLQMNLDRALQEKKEVEARNAQLHKAAQELQRQNEDLQKKLANRDRDYEIMSKNYLDHVRTIRATDDDHSTIGDKLNQLKALIEHMIRKTQGSKSANLNKAAAIEHFRNSGLLEEFPVRESNLEPSLLNLYMESVVMSHLVTSFFDKPLSSVFDYNSGFKDIYEWMYTRNNVLAVRWRQQLCVMLTQDPVAKARREALVTKTTNELTALISKVYSNANESTKIRELCVKAFELSVAMTALESVISPVYVQLGIPFDEDIMATSHKSSTDGKVALLIFPGFKDSNENGFYSKSKVWCY
ncbi:hypothetical protein BGZ80_010185 [Entomortierella chlamydospora]|uniref:Uncharacterized protein n=1 Tax=Entomortierella chlamydospora TaxID=101097 RepID=A0A9P6MVX8_9FUNG|nr:hypothetical protein BGZ79_010158 [Entomortierella chlamydospora]KAG0014860.1 hypothetical protein BGZ80_010185 [Entomortierella chlamydospora]